MKITRKPLFAEIASGGRGKAGAALGDADRRNGGGNDGGSVLDPRMPKPDACVQRYMLDRLAQSAAGQGVREFRRWSGMDLCARRAISPSATANAFRKLGVRQGDRVLVWLPNSADNLRVWFGLNYLGAVYVPINLAYKGSLLQHTLNIVRSAARRGPRRPARAARRGRAPTSA